jgi:tripartite-type tricarboxylate transporter receptor subunit TctC
VTSKQIPADRLAALRKAFDETMADKDFLAAAEKQRLNINPATGAEAEKIIEQIYNVSPPVAERAREVIK